MYDKFGDETIGSISLICSPTHSFVRKYSVIEELHSLKSIFFKNLYREMVYLRENPNP